MIGKVFHSQLLYDIIPTQNLTMEEFAEHLTQLCSKDFFKKVDTMPKHYAFINSTLSVRNSGLVTHFQEIANEMLLFSFKTSLNLAICDWYETQYANDLSSHVPTIAFHLFKAVKLMDQPGKNLKIIQVQFFASHRVID